MLFGSEHDAFSKSIAQCFRFILHQNHLFSIFALMDWSSANALSPCSLLGVFPCHSYLFSNSLQPLPGVVRAMIAVGLPLVLCAFESALLISPISWPSISTVCRPNARSLS